MDQPNYLALLKRFIPTIPRVATDAAYHTLGLTETSKKWDLTTAVIVSVIRSFLDSPTASPVSRQQGLSLKDPGIKGPIWISKQSFPVSDEDAYYVLQQIVNAITALAADESETAFERPEIRPIEIEWTGFRDGANGQAPRPDLDEAGQYKKLMADVKTDTTILYMHGGALYLMDPATHRPTCLQLAKLTGGRCASVRYRLAPQHPFPAALLDVLVAYLCLLYPPPLAVHYPVAAKNVVFAGDSAGGTLSFALLQLILQLHRESEGQIPTVQFYGKQVEIPLPAGLATFSPWVDLTRCLPSITSNLVYDYLPAPRPDYAKVFEPDSIWPTKPPRGDLYCNTSMLSHPLVNPIAAGDWSGSPPVFICVGQECLTDEGKIMARRLANSGSHVHFAEFEAMPHVFPAVFKDLPGARTAMVKWATAINRMVANELSSSSGVYVEAKTLKEKQISITDFLPELSDDVVTQKMKAAQAQRDMGESQNEQYMARL